jgi:hypothetical protein
MRAKKCRRGAEPLCDDDQVDLLNRIDRKVDKLETDIGRLAESAALIKIASDAESEVSPADVKVTDPGDLPLYAGAQEIHQRIGINEQQLLRLVSSGYVDKAKLGDSRQAGAKYYVPQVVEVLARIRRGLQPILRKDDQR